MFSKQTIWFITGLCFAFFWSSAATATKIGLAVAQPMVIACTRFALAALILIVMSHLIQKNRLPKGNEWLYVSIYGALNISIYLGLYIVAMQEVTAGIGSLSVAINPVLISFFSVIFLKKKLTVPLILALITCTTGVFLAAFPLFGQAVVTLKGLGILFVSMLSYTGAAIYFSRKNWSGLNLLTINAWQTAIGGVLLIPFALIFYRQDANQYNSTFWTSVLWLAIPVSIGAVQLWLRLLQANTVRAGLWLFLCPLFGFIFAAKLANEPISIFTYFGILLVLSGLMLSRLAAKQ